MAPWMPSTIHPVPSLCTMHIAGPQVRRQAVALAIEQQQRVVAGGLKVAVIRWNAFELYFSMIMNQRRRPQYNKKGRSREAPSRPRE